MASIYWLVAFVVLIGIEAATMALTTLWFAGGALIAFALALFGVGVEIQLAVFFVVSCVLLFFTRPFAMKFVNKNTVKTNVESLVGRQARVTEEIDNIMSTGIAVVNGQEWTARSFENGKKIPSGAIVTIREIRGVKLVVSEKQEEK